MELSKIQKQNIRIYGIHYTDNYDDSKPFWEEISSKTGGEYISLENMPSIVEIVTGLCYKEASDM